MIGSRKWKRKKTKAKGDTVTKEKKKEKETDGRGETSTNLPILALVDYLLEGRRDLIHCVNVSGGRYWERTPEGRGCTQSTVEERSIPENARRVLS